MSPDPKLYAIAFLQAFMSQLGLKSEINQSIARKPIISARSDFLFVLRCVSDIIHEKLLPLLRVSAIFHRLTDRIENELPSFHFSLA